MASIAAGDVSDDEVALVGGGGPAQCAGAEPPPMAVDAPQAHADPPAEALQPLRYNTVLAEYAVRQRAQQLIDEVAGEAAALPDAAMRAILDADPSSGYRGDVLITLQNQIIADMSVIAPTAQAYVARAAAPRACAALRDKQKRAKYARYGVLPGTFVPCSVETYGALGEPFMQLLSDLAKRAAPANDQSGRAAIVFMKYALQEISVALVRGNALMLRSNTKRLCRAVGKDHRPGLEFASSDPAFGS